MLTDEFSLVHQVTPEATVETRVAAYSAFYQSLFQDAAKEELTPQETGETTLPVGLADEPPLIATSRFSSFDATTRLQRWWRSMRQRLFYKRLLQRMQLAEECFSAQALKKFAPREGCMADPKLMRMKIKFKLDGHLPYARIIYKLYSCGLKAQYYAGENMIPILSESAKEAWRWMGTPAYLGSQVYTQSAMHATSVYSRQTYQAYLSYLDELPIHQGGRSNAWRLLTEEDAISRMLISYEQSLRSIARWKKAQKELPKRTTAESTRKERRKQLEQMKQLYLHPQTANIAEDSENLLDWAADLALSETAW